MAFPNTWWTNVGGWLGLPRLILCLFVVLSACPERALAWGTKEHVLLTRLAVLQLLDDPGTPEEMKRWLKDGSPELGDVSRQKEMFLHQRMGVIPRAVDGLAYWGVMPDLEASRENVAPFGVPERQLHFLDLEYFAGPANATYADDLSHKPAADAMKRDMTDPRWAKAGMLPFRVEDCFRRMVRSLRDGRMNDKPGQFPRDDHAVRWAGFLAHYAADNTQPQHATLDYKSASYLADRPMDKGPNIHSALEWLMADDDLADHDDLRRDYWTVLQTALAEFKDPVTTRDPWQATVEVSLASYDALPLIGRAARAATRTGKLDLDVFFRFKGQYAGREQTVLEMKAFQQAWAVRRIAALWKHAWIEAHSPTSRPAHPTTQQDK